MNKQEIERNMEIVCKILPDERSLVQAGYRLTVAYYPNARKAYKFYWFLGKMKKDGSQPCFVKVVEVNVDNVGGFSVKVHTYKKVNGYVKNVDTTDSLPKDYRLKVDAIFGEAERNNFYSEAKIN